MKRRYNALKELTLARIREFYREPEVIFWVYVFPILLIVGLGVAFRGGVEETARVRVAAEPYDLEWIAAALASEAAIQVEKVPISRAREFDPSDPPDLLVIASRDTAGNGEPLLRFVFDDSRAGSRSAYRRVNKLLQEARGREDPVPTVIEDETRRYIDWLIPGLMGMNIMGGGLWGVGFVTVDLRMRKLLKRFYATPMRRGDFLLALMGSRLMFLVPEMAVILVVGYLLFGVGVQGSILGLTVVVLLGAASFAGLGLLVACRAQKIETISGLLNTVMMPMWILSGVFFSSERFPAAMQPIVQALPLTQLNNALRAIMLEGTPLYAQWLPLAALALWGGLSFPVALRWFRWQ